MSEQIEPISKLYPEQEAELRKILEREPTLADQLITFHNEHGVPPIDVIAVTAGPGLEPALWVGVNFAKALAYLWKIKMIPVNHLEGHVLASIFDIEEDNKPKAKEPVVELSDK